MSTAKQVYKNPEAGQPLITVISSKCQTPLLDLKFSTLVKPFYYPNSPGVARYSVTCVVDPKKDKDFLAGLQAIEKNEQVESIIKNETVKEGNEIFNTGKVLVKFQTKEQIPVYIATQNPDGSMKAEPIELEDELARGEQIVVVYDILRYTKKNNTAKVEHGLSFKPLLIYYYPKAQPAKVEG